jgi:cell division protein FtsN
VKPFWLVIVCAVAASSPALAITEFYLEIGSDASKEDAQKQWDELSTKFKGLSTLTYFPKTVMESGEGSVTRIQAGPLESKEQAQKICNRLFKNNISCFVIEGIDGKPPTTVMNLTEQAANPVKVIQLPWLAGDVAPPAPIEALPVAEAPSEESITFEPQPSEAPVAAVTEEPVVIAQEEPPIEALQPLVAPVAKADVKVSEAIRVAVSDNQTQQQNAIVTVKSLPDLKPVFTPAAGAATYADESDSSGEGWLVVESFPSEDIASSFWDEARRTAPKASKNLRSQMLKVASVRGVSRSTLNVGTFASSSVAYQFCREVLQARERGLNCRFSTTEPVAQPAVAAPVEARRTPIENPPASGAKAYWVAVGSAPSQEDAVQLWGTIRSEHKDLIQGLRNSISASKLNNGEYIVRVGPIPSPADATALCSRLQEHGVDCSVSASSR